MNVKEIVKKYLEDNNYDGLHCDECGCEISDLIPCECDWITDCEPGYKSKCDPETCPADGNCDFHIGPERE